MFLSGGGDLLSFSVTVSDPCDTSTIDDPSLTAMNLKNGGSATITFTEATDSVDASNTVAGLCGGRNYAIYDSNTGSPTAISWMSVAADTPSVDTHTITASPDDQSLVTGSTITVYLRIMYANYPSHAAHYTALSIQVTNADCDCELLTWDNPSRLDQTINVGVGSSTTITIPTATVNTVSKSASQEISACYLSSGTCAETSTLSLLFDTGAALSSASDFITVAGDSTSIAVYPVGPTAVGTWTIMLTQDTASGPNPTFAAVQIIVGCTITDVASPTAPDEANSWTLTYEIYGNALSIDLSTIAYPQTPLCGYSVTETFVWTIPSGAPITVDTVNAEKINV